jgi:HAE1 family hydrophobic/amphiphilic exporter-1
MTTLALVAGSLPVAMGIHIVGTGEGGEFRKGLATVLIGGLLTSMFLTLLVVPTAYSLMESLTERGAQFFKRFNRDDDDDLDSDPQAEQPATPPLTLAGAGNSGATVALATPNGAPGINGSHTNGAHANGTNGANGVHTERSNEERV